MSEPQPRPIRLITLNPGHFHAALVQKQMLPGVSPKVFVYGPLDIDLTQHITRISGFNNRASEPTAWELDVRAGEDFFDRFIREQPGNTVVLSGKNKSKIDLLLASVGQGLNALADKPWVIEPEDFPILEEVFHHADLRELLVWDIMTERFEVTNLLQRELMRDPAIYGDQLKGTLDDPGLTFESVHFLKKQVAGVPLRRPWWWFDVTIAGDAIADVGTHLADLALWMLAPNRSVSHLKDVQVLDASRWPLALSRGDFEQITGLPDFPEELQRWVAGDNLQYFGNGMASIVVRSVHVRLAALWELEAKSGEGDTHESIARGSLATVIIRPDRTLGVGPQIFVEAAKPADHEQLLTALRHRCNRLQDHFPGISVENLGNRFLVQIPAELRTGHESHFASVLEEYIRYFHHPRQIPSWERPNLLSKYFITTQAVAISRAKTGGA